MSDKGTPAPQPLPARKTSQLGPTAYQSDAHIASTWRCRNARALPQGSIDFALCSVCRTWQASMSWLISIWQLASPRSGSCTTWLMAVEALREFRNDDQSTCGPTLDPLCLSHGPHALRSHVAPSASHPSATRGRTALRKYGDRRERKIAPATYPRVVGTHTYRERSIARTFATALMRMQCLVCFFHRRETACCALAVSTTGASTKVIPSAHSHNTSPRNPVLW